MKKKRPAIGIENFEELRKEGFYYVDKTGMIRELLHHWGKVNLFTRPRRFGKSLNMSMLQYFFEPGTEKEIFDGLEISFDSELCEKYMGKYPVIAISLKGINASCYEAAQDMTIKIINKEVRRHQYLLESSQLSQQDKQTFLTIMQSNMNEPALYSSLNDLSELLHRHYSQKVILLIDEYDVPLAKAFANGYYNQMSLLIQNLFSQTLKTNYHLHFAVLTGCLRIAKESIFTGLNNLKVLSITDERFAKYFGFTDPEVRKLLEYYELSEVYEEVKAWYDGYRFGNTQIYCPWDVINYCDLLLEEHNAKPQDYWSNTSSNDVIRYFIEHACKGTTKQEIERLVAGESVTKKIRQNLTYQELYNSVDNLWSVLFTTGYLTQQEKLDGDLFRLVIPNREIRKVFTEQIMEYFKKTRTRMPGSIGANPAKPI